MVIELNKLFYNKTSKYLLPLVKSYNSLFIDKLASVYKLGIGIGDDLLDHKKFKSEKALYILIDTGFQPKNCDTFFDWIKNHESYVTDYPYKGLGRCRMLVIRLPEDYHNTYDNFMKGNYKDMLSKEDIDVFFPKRVEVKEELKKSWQEAREVFLCEKPAKERFLKTLRNYYGNDITVGIEDLENSNLDLPISLNMISEVFNYKKK